MSNLTAVTVSASEVNSLTIALAAAADRATAEGRMSRAGQYRTLLNRLVTARDTRDLKRFVVRVAAAKDQLYRAVREGMLNGLTDLADLQARIAAI